MPRSARALVLLIASGFFLLVLGLSALVLAPFWLGIPIFLACSVVFLELLFLTRGSRATAVQTPQHAAYEWRYGRS